VRLDEPVTWEVAAVARDPRSRRREETHRRIYEAAMRLFHDKGFEAVSVGEIARAAGVSVPTFYAHFVAKEQILLPLPERREVAATLAAQPVGLPVSEHVRAAMLAWISAAQGSAREELLDRWTIVVSTPGLRLRAAEYERTTAAMVVDALPPAAVAGDRRLATELVVTTLFSAYTQILVRWAEDGGQRSLEDVADEVLTTLDSLRPEVD